MNDYTGKVCPYCKTAFKPDDKIVICSECDMPHHKDCWIENQGCTTFGCLGTIESADDNDNSSVTTREMKLEDVQQSVGKVVYCTKCGAQNAGTSLFCSKCGNRLSTSAATETSTFQQSNSLNIDPHAYVNRQGDTYQKVNSYAHLDYNDTEVDADIQMLIGVNSDYYLPKFQEIRGLNKKNTWNWPAFLITPYWMIYRKMYVYGAVALGISFVLPLLENTIGYLLLLCGYIALGIFGNYIYMDFLKKKAIKVKAMNEPFKTRFVVKNSGVNSIAAVLTAVVYAFFIIILSL